MTPNAELAYRVLDHIDAHPEQWDQGIYIRKAECGTAACFAGWTVLLSGAKPISGFQTRVAFNGKEVSVPLLAEKLLGAVPAIAYGNENFHDAGLFDPGNTREDLGRLVLEIFGPRAEEKL
jgi:hypothetical protein